MGIDFTVFKGSDNGDIVEAKGHREVGPTEALIEISHCGVCGTDEHYRHANMGLGHELVGIVRELGSNTARLSELKVGDRVGMGWIQRACTYCEACLRGEQMYCLNQVAFGSGNHDEGGFGTGGCWDVASLYKIPEGIESKYVGPLMCGGATVWGPLYDHGMKAGDRVGVVGIGGLGHLAIQYGSKLGYEIVVFSGTESKKEEAIGFGAAEFHATKGVNKFEGVQKLDHLIITTSFLPDLNL
jgi:D-arabinose 1-dehydrogenase-like Zn-dependent alcohol dehydrogenase